MAADGSTLKPTEQQAYQAMLLFLEQSFDRTGADDTGSLLGSASLLWDGISADPAIYEDWRACLHSVMSGENRGGGVVQVAPNLRTCANS